MTKFAQYLHRSDVFALDAGYVALPSEPEMYSSPSPSPAKCGLECDSSLRPSFESHISGRELGTQADCATSSEMLILHFEEQR